MGTFTGNCLRTLMTYKRIIPKHSCRYSQNVSNEFVFKYLKGDHLGITTFGINRPQQKNAISMHLLDQLKKAVDRVSYEKKTHVLVIHSLAPGVFCAGADLKERAEMCSKDVCDFVIHLRELVNRIYNLPVPVIAALDGIALGGGLEMALACDIRIASSNARMGLVETKLAIMPGAGGTQLLPRIVNPSIAKELIFTAKIVDAKTADKIGLVNHVVEQNEDGNAAFSRSLELAEEILPNGPVGIKMSKKAINNGIEVDLSSGLTIEEACYAQLIPTKDRTEGLQAFKEKRRPVYMGH